MRPTALDHVALWVDERDALAAFLVEVCEMHEIERSEAFTLLGGDARRGKLTLFAADGAREPGLLERVVLRVPDLSASLDRHPSAGADRDGVALLQAPSGLPLGLVQGAPSEPADLDRVVLRVPDPAATAAALGALGLERRADHFAVGDRHLLLRPGRPVATARPLLNHLGLLVDSAGDVRAEAAERGLEVERVVDAPNTIAVFLRGPDGLSLEYVEHKPSFALA